MLALDIPQVSLIGRMLRRRELLEPRGEMAPEALELPRRQLPVPTVGRPQQQNLPRRGFVRDVVDHLVEKLLLSHRQVVERQQLAPFQMVLRIEFEQHLQQRRRKFEIIDQEVVDGRRPDQFQGRPRIAVVPFEIHLLILGNQLRKALKRLKAGVAGPFDIPLVLHLPRPGQHSGKIIRSLSDHLERLVRSGFKHSLSHRRVAI